MGKIKQGILGPFSGKVGNVVGATSNGVHYMRVIPANVRDPKTDKQLAQRQRFGLMTSTLKKFRPVVNIGFRKKTGNTSPANRALSYNLKNAITGEYPDQEIDYTAFLVARGDLTKAVALSAVSENPGEITFSWTDNSGEGSAKADDAFTVACYDPDEGNILYRIEAAVREDETVSINMPQSFQGQLVQVYAFFASEAGDDVTDSHYAGGIQIQPQA